MNRNKYFKAFVDVSNIFLKQDEAKQEYEYLTSRISSDYIDKFQFGYFPSDYVQTIKFIDEFGKIIKEEPINILKNLGAIYVTEKYNKIVPKFKYHKLLIPFYDVYGNVVSVVGRTILNEEERKTHDISKYNYITFNKRNHIYGLNFSCKNMLMKDYAVIVEGQFDFLSGFINGIDNIAALGGSKFTFEHIALLKRFTNNFYILLDNDEAGEKGMESIKKNASKYNIKIYQLALPKEFKDLDEYLKTNKIDDIRKFII